MDPQWPSKRTLRSSVPTDSTPRSSFIALRAKLHRASRERRADCSDRDTYKTDIEQRFRRKQARGRLNGDGESTRFARFSSSPVLCISEAPLQTDKWLRLAR